MGRATARDVGVDGPADDVGADRREQRTLGQQRRVGNNWDDSGRGGCSQRVAEVVRRERDRVVWHANNNHNAEENPSATESRAAGDAELRRTTSVMSEAAASCRAGAPSACGATSNALQVKLKLMTPCTGATETGTTLPALAAFVHSST